MATSVDGYLFFIRNIMGVPLLALPDDAPVIPYSLTAATGIINPLFQSVPLGSGSAFDVAAYNLAGDMLITFGNDTEGRSYFKDLRDMYNINSFQPGVTASSSNAVTSQSLLNPEFMKMFTLSDLQNLKTPFGRQYLMMAQAYGTLWGLS